MGSRDAHADACAWEYTVLDTNEDGETLVGTLGGNLRGLGREGWELAVAFATAGGHRLVFKRPRSNPSKSTRSAAAKLGEADDPTFGIPR